MGFSFEQSQRQEQRQVLSQRLIRSMELLQLPLQRLEERIERELQTNPALERLDERPLDPDSDDLNLDARPDARLEAGEAPASEKEAEIVIRETGDARDDFATADEFAETYADTIDERPVRSQNWLDEAQRRDHDLMASLPSPSETLEEHLSAQLDRLELSESLRTACGRIVSGLDANGYLRIKGVKGEDAPATDAYGYLLDPLTYLVLGDSPTETERSEALEALRIVQRLEPRGVAGRNLAETLLLQLDETPDDAAARTLITDYLADLENNRLGRIAQVTGWSFERLEAILARIRRLNPRPGGGFREIAAPGILPDVYADRAENGRWFVRLDEGTAGELGINPEFPAMLRDRRMDRGTKDYVRQNITHAKWLIDALAQRKETLLRVSQAIVDHQRDFFEGGPERLKPLRMQQIADEVGIHVATVSRTCDEKYLQSPQGIFPLRRFFSGAVTTGENDGESVAKETAMKKLRQIIDTESKTSPDSDEELVKKMETAGIPLSRRTVAKYRDEMNIPNSRGRKVWY